MNQLEKIATFRAELAIAETYEEISVLDSAAAAMAEFARLENISVDKQQEIGEYRVEAKAKKGEWLNEFFPSTSRKFAGHQPEPAKMPADKKESAICRRISKNEEKKKEVIKQLKAEMKIITPSLVASRIKSIIDEESREDKIEQFGFIPEMYNIWNLKDGDDHNNQFEMKL